MPTTIDLDLLQNNGWTARRVAEGWEIVDPKGTTIRTGITRADAKSLVNLLSAERPTETIPKEAEQLINNAWSEEKVLAVCAEIFRDDPERNPFGVGTPTFEMHPNPTFKESDFTPEQWQKHQAKEVEFARRKEELDRTAERLFGPGKVELP